MAFTVTFAPEAVAEVAVIASWWNEHRPASPRLFQVELDRAVLRLVEHPQIGRPVRAVGHSNLRALVLKRSGYLVFYQLRVDERLVVVVRVRHGRRRPLRRR